MKNSILLLVAPLFVACSAVDDAVDKVNPDAPHVTAEKATVTKISPMGIGLLLDLGAHNPNDIDLEARAVTAKVVLDKEHDMGTVEIPHEVDLPSEQNIRISVPVFVDWKDVTVIARLIALKRSIPYAIDGSVKVGVDLFKFDVPFKVENVITEAQLRDAAGLPPLDAGLPPLDAGLR